MDTQGWREHVFGADSHVGYDVILTPPRRCEEVPCRVCGTLCNARRDLYETAELNPALGPQLALHDRFECPHRAAGWHREARALVQRIEAAADELARAPIYARLEAILRERRMPSG